METAVVAETAAVAAGAAAGPDAAGGDVVAVGAVESPYGNSGQTGGRLRSVPGLAEKSVVRSSEAYSFAFKGLYRRFNNKGVVRIL